MTFFVQQLKSFWWVASRAFGTICNSPGLRLEDIKDPEIGGACLRLWREIRASKLKTAEEHSKQGKYAKVKIYAWGILVGYAYPELYAIQAPNMTLDTYVVLLKWLHKNALAANAQAVRTVQTARVELGLTTSAPTAGELALAERTDEEAKS